MTFRTAISLIAAILAGVVIYVVVVVSRNQVQVVNIADWDNGSRTLRLAAPMPSCACMTLAPKDRGSLTARATRAWDNLRAFRFGSDPSLDFKDITLVSRLDIGTRVGSLPLKRPGNTGSWAFAFDWAGDDVGSHYEVQAFATQDVREDGTLDHEARPLDMNALFWMEAVPHESCVQAEASQCPWGSLRLNQAVGAPIGQNEIASSFAGARLAKDDHVIELQATGKYRGAQGDCGCALLRVLQAPTTLRGSLGGVNLGQVELGQVGALLAIPFDYASNAGNSSYELTVNDGTDPITDAVRLLGHLDGMNCEATAATFATHPPSAPAALDLAAPPASGQSAAAGTQPPNPAAFEEGASAGMLACPYDLNDPAKKISGGLNFLQATKVNPQAPKGGTAPAGQPPARGGGPPKGTR